MCFVCICLLSLNPTKSLFAIRQSFYFRNMEKLLTQLYCYIDVMKLTIINSLVTLFRDINPHIPQYIKDSPWYLEMEGLVFISSLHMIIIILYEHSLFTYILYYLYNVMLCFIIINYDESLKAVQ